MTVDRLMPRRPESGVRCPGAVEQALQRIWRLGRRIAPVGFVSAVERSRIPRAIVPAFSTANPSRFAALELIGRKRLRKHALRGGDWSFCVHHGTADASVVGEVFRLCYYRIPYAIERQLRELGRPPRVVDLGAHVGLFAVWIAGQFPSAEIVSFEPDPTNFRALLCTIGANRPRSNSWQAVPAAAATEDGSVPFRAGWSSSSRILRSAGADTFRAEARDVFPHLAHGDVVKIDIEGGEWALLADERFAQVSPALLFFEYHRNLSPSDDPRRHAMRALEAAGYEIAEVFAAPDVGLLRAVPSRRSRRQ